MTLFADVDLAALLPFVAVGFAAQVVDGALGMAFGVISNTLLLWIGVPPAAASAGVHTVETFTTAVSGISHAVQRNVDWRLFFRLVIPGVVGGVCGAYLLSNIDAAFTMATIGLLIGGVIAAPIGAVLAKRMPPQRLLLLVGTILTLTSLVGLYHALIR